MAPEHPTPQMLALDTIEERSLALTVAMHDKRDAAKIHRRWAAENEAAAEVKDLEADAIRARINRLSLVRARLMGVAVS